MKKLTGLADRAMREQIGAICVHWSLVELMVERVIANLEGRPGVVTYKDDVRRRLETLKKLAQKHLPQHANEIATIAGTIKTLCADRDRVVHGLWGIDETNTFVAIHPWAKSPAPHAKPMQLEEIRQIKLRIWRAYQQLEPFGGPEKSVLSPRRQPKRPPGS